MTESEVALNEIQSLLEADFNVSSISDYKKLYKNVELMLKPGLVQEFTNERDYTPDDFRDVACRAVDVFSRLKHLLPKLKNKLVIPKQRKSILIPVLILCGTHSDDFPWSNDESICLSADTVKAVTDFADVPSLEDLLCHDGENESSSLFKNILLTLRPELTKDTWMRIPSTCHVFIWLLSQIKHPHLTAYLPDVLPPSLMFADHFLPRYKILAVSCLDHIIDNVPPSELKLYGRADVVYDALFHLTYSTELEVLHILYPCLLKLLKGQEGNMHQKLEPRRWNRYDEVYNHFIVKMEMEDTIAMRREFSSILPEFIQTMGVTAAKHLKRTLRVLFDYTAVHDGTHEICKKNALKSLIVIIKYMWPRMGFHCKDIVKSIVTCLYENEVDDQYSVDEKSLKDLQQLCNECLCLLQIACPERFQEIISDLKLLGEDFPGMRHLQCFIK